MPDDQHTQLLHQRVKYLQRALALKKDDYLSRKDSYDRVIEKLADMINSGAITSYLGIDSTYYHLMEKLEMGEGDLDKFATEMIEFIS